MFLLITIPLNPTYPRVNSSSSNGPFQIHSYPFIHANVYTHKWTFSDKIINGIPINAPMRKSAMATSRIIKSTTWA